MDELRHKFSGRSVMLVSHADVMAAICRMLGQPADNCFRFDIDPASISVVVVDD